MRNRLLILCCLAHDPQGVLAAIHQFALVGIERRPEFGFRVIFQGLIGMELRIAAFADAKSHRRALYDPKIAFLHDRSLAHRQGRA